MPSFGIFILTSLLVFTEAGSNLKLPHWIGSTEMPSFGIFILTSLLVFTEAGSLNKIRSLNTCAVQCSDNNKFDYQPGTVYEFSYDAKTTTKMNGASEDSATINMNAKVEIEPLTKCDLLMRIKDASLRDSEDDQNSQAFKEAMMKQPLKFSFQDGRIDHICAMEGESTWTLNIKRGILSAFQNSMDSFDRNQNLTETDVVGSCDSEYKILDTNGRTMVVEKTKNLLGCTDREGYHMAVQSIGYNVPSFVKSLPLMKSEYKCTQTLDLGSNILQSSTCSEEHVFRPFSNGKNGAMTTNEQTLTFTNKRRAGRSSKEHFSRRSTLLFHHQHDTESKQEKEEKIEAKLQELCQKAAEDIRPEVPEMVNQLIEHMRQVDRDVLSRVYRKINQKRICAPKANFIRQYFHDAIPMVGTAASVGMIQDLISKEYVTGSEVEMWLLSLTFVHQPTKEMVAAVMPLLDAPDVSGNTLLAVSSLASSYCNVRPDCGKDSEISALIRKLMALTRDCNAQNGDVRKTVFALRALGNIGHSHEAVSHLTRCSTRRDVPEEIRIAAMDAFRRVPCDAMRSDLMGVFRDESEDSELRLNAYIALMKCPSRELLSEVRQVLEKEKSNQVGSFVWTHLTNLMETSDPHMQDIRNIVQDEELKKEFNLDQRKFSRNYEGSFFLDSINTGAKVDSNVIFSEKSFIPRSANLNLTIDLFGHAINFLEVGGRVKGTEKILENFFGPTGVKEPKMKTETPTNFDKSMDSFGASAFLRVFGSELRYWDDKSLNELQSSLRRLINMQAVSFSKTLQLIDSRMVIPTCVGLPLKLTMSATGSISLGAKASFQQSNLALNVDFKPSASVQVKGEMSVDAHVSRAGLKMVTVAHTSTGAKLDIRSNKFDLQIPQKKMEIFNLKTDFYIIHRNTEKKQKMIVDNVQKHEICTGRLMKQVTGLTFCQNIKFSNASRHNEAPFFPFTGPVVYDLYMLNEDAPNGYQIEGFTKQSPYSFYMDTSNSKVSRRIALDTVMKNKNEAQITFTSPWKTIKVEGTVVNMDEMKKLTGKLSLDGRTDYTLNAELGMKNTKGLWSITPKFEITIPQKKMEYEGKIEVRPMKSVMIDMSAMGFLVSDINLKVSGEIVPKEIGLTTQLRIGKKEYYIAGRLGRLVSKSGFKYSPSLKITIPKRDLVEFTSEILYESNKKMSFDLKLNKVLPKTVAMNAIVLLNTGKTKTKHILKVVFKSHRVTFKIFGDVDNQKRRINYNLGAKYSDYLTRKVRDLGVREPARYMGNIALASKKRESLNFNLKGQLAKAINHLETKFDLQYGNPKIKTNNLKFALGLNRALTPFGHSYDYTMAIQHPGQKIDYRMEVHHLQSATWPFKKFENTVTIQSASENVLKTRLSFSYNDTRTGIYNTEMTVSLAGEKEIKFIGMIQATSGAYKAKVSLEADPGLISNGRIHYMTEAGVQYTLKATQISTDANIDVMWAKDTQFDGKSVMIRADYKKEGSTYKVTGTLGLPDGRSLKMEGSLDLQNIAASLKTMSPDFPELTEVDMAFSFNGDTPMSDSTTSLKVMPYFDTIQVEVKFTQKQFIIEMKTQFESMKQAKVTVTYDGDWVRSQMVKTVFQLNNEQIVDLDTNYNFKSISDFVVSMTVLTSHKRYKEFQFDLKNKGPLSDMQSSLKLKLTNVLMLDVMFQNSGDVSNLSLGAQLMGSGEWKSTPYLQPTLAFSLIGNLKKFNCEFKIHFDKKIYEMKASNEEFFRQMNFLLNTPFLNCDFQFEGDLENAKGTFSVLYGKTKYEVSFTHIGNLNDMQTTLLYKLDGKEEFKSNLTIKGYGATINAMMEIPDILDFGFESESDMGNVVFNLRSNLELQQEEIYKIVAIYEHVTKLYVKTSVLSYNGELKMTFDKNENASLKLKLANVIRLEAIFQNSSRDRKMSLDGQLLVFNERRSTFVLKGNLDSRLTASIITSIGKKRVNRIDVRLKEYGRSIKVKVNGPKSVHFDFNMDLDNTEAITFNMASTFTMNGREKYGMSVSYEHLSTLQIKTSIPSYKDELLIMFSGNLKAFNVQTKFSHNNLMYELMLSNKEYYRQLKGILNTPYFQDTATFRFDGELSEMKIVAQVMHNKEKFELTFSNSGYYQQIDAKLDTPYFQPTLEFSLIGNPRKFNCEFKIQFDKQIYEMKASNGDYFRQMNFLLDTPFLNCNFQFEGDLENAKGNFNVSYNTNKYELTISNQGYYRKMDAKLVTPFFTDMASFIFKGDEETFTAQAKFMHDNDQYELVVSNRNHYRQLTITLSTPFSSDKLDIDFKGDLSAFGATVTFSHNKVEYELKVSGEGYYRKINAKLTTPTFKTEVLFKLKGDLQTFNSMTELIYNGNNITLHLSNKDYYKQMSIKLITPFSDNSLLFSLDGNLNDFKANLTFKHFKDLYELVVYNSGYHREIEAKLLTSYFRNVLSISVDGKLSGFTVQAKVMHNHENYKLTVSNARYFRTLSVELSTPFYEGSVVFSLEGDLKAFQMVADVMHNKDKFQLTVSTINYYRQMKAELTTPFYVGSVEFFLDGNLESFNTKLKVTHSGDLYQLVVSNSEYHRNIDIDLNTPVFHKTISFNTRGHPGSFDIVAEIKQNQNQNLYTLFVIKERTSFELKANVTNRFLRETVHLTFNGNLKSFNILAKALHNNDKFQLSLSTLNYYRQMKAELTTPYFKDSVEFFLNGTPRKFNTKLTLKHNSIAYEVRASNRGFYHQMNFQLSTPLLRCVAQTRTMRDGQVKAELDVKLPNQQYSLNIDWSNGTFNALLNLDMDKNDKDKQYQFQTSYKNTDQRADVARSFNFKMIIPQRTVSLDSSFENTQKFLIVNSDLMWDEARGQKVGFELMVHKEETEGKFRIITPRRTIQLFGKVGVNGNHYSTMGHIMMCENNQSQKVDIKADMMILSDRADIDLTVKFPNQKKGMNLKTSVNLPKGDIIFSSSSEFSMDQDPKKTFKLSTKLMSETKGRRQVYTVQMDAGHAISGFATEMIGRVSSSPEKYNADVEMGYLTSKRQQQKFAIRGEMHRFNREVNLKLESPSKTIELDGSLSAGNRYMMSMLKKESGKENMEALFKLNPNSQRMNIIFNYDEENPDNVYRIDAEIMESKTLLKAYRVGKKGTFNEDVAIHAELKSRLLKSGIKWNPHLLREFNMFGGQKLITYRKELNSFGDSLSQVLNDEVSMKFDLIKESFSEDMPPIIIYIDTEYRRLSKDLARAMHHMNQMFEQDSFYMKSAIEAIGNVWDEKWLNFNKYLIELKQEIEVFNGNMNNKMDEAKKQFDFYYGQYSMQLRNKINDCFAHCHRQLEMLYERAMEMEAEIVSFVKNYPETIKGLIDRMRQNPYGENVIDFLMEMYEAFNEKTVQAKEHVETLTSAIYSAHATLNHHIASVRHYPIVDAILDSVDKVYQQVLWSYNYWDVKDNVLGLKNTLYKFGTKKINEIKDIITDVGMNTLVFDPSRGEILVEIRFGAAKYFYNHFMSGVEDVERAVMKLRNLLPSFNLNVWDIYYMLKPSSDLDEYIPPFKAEATLFAGQHITTFDGRHLNYKGTCSYLLARDFVDGNFTVVVNFGDALEGKTLDSLSVTTAHDEQLEIFPDNKVSFNGSADVKLPLQLTDATVTRQGNVIVVESKRGYKVMCDHDLQLYTVQISGWYFNKVAGLFGNYNNEPRDDMLMSNNRYTDDLEQFAQSWSTSRQCDFAPSHVVPENKECANFFLQTDSPFRYCFRQVNPDQFYKTCAMQLSSSKAISMDLCNVTSFYQKKCEKKGVYLSMPIMCPKKM